MKKVSSFKKLFCIFLTFAILMSLPAAAFAVSLDELQQAQEEVKNNINRYKNIINSTKSEINSVSSEMANLDQRIQAREKEISALEMAIAEKEAMISGLEEDLVMTELGYASRQQTLQNRLRAIYENKDVDYVEVLVDSTDMTDFLVRYELLSRLAGGDISLLDELDSQRRTLEEMKISLVEDQKSLEESRAELEASKNSLYTAKSDKVSLQNKLLSEKEVAQKALDEEQESNKEIEAMIKDYIASQKNGGSYTGGKFTWPTPGYTRITSPYGWRIHPITKKRSMHTGIDIAANGGSRIVAAANGTVIYAAWYGAYGNCTIIDHGGGLTSMYGHQSKLAVQKGDIVIKGNTIGYVGTTGLSTGNHLHFEVRIQGNHTSPWPYLNGDL
ncbi:peptidoglycan DD-metalloendopeptidase family protein [Clostridia bacterium]|nr:peptidoglycan DD-metalloendopeptidase family protein [Clostridia bacterium]